MKNKGIYLLIFVVILMNFPSVICQIGFDPTTITNYDQSKSSIHLHSRIDNSILFPGFANSTNVDGVLKDLNSDMFITNSIIIGSDYKYYNDYNTVFGERSFKGGSLGLFLVFDYGVLNELKDFGKINLVNGLQCSGQIIIKGKIIAIGLGSEMVYEFTRNHCVSLSGSLSYCINNYLKYYLDVPFDSVFDNSNLIKEGSLTRINNIGYETKNLSHLKLNYRYIIPFHDLFNKEKISYNCIAYSNATKLIFSIGLIMTAGDEEKSNYYGFNFGVGIGFPVHTF